MTDSGTGDGGTGREPGSDQPGWAAPTPPPAAPAAPAGFPAPPAYGTPFGTAGTATTRRRRRWPWVLGALLAAIVVLGVTGTVLFVQKIKPPIDAANEFLSDVDDGDSSAAFDQVCSRDRDLLSEEDVVAIFTLYDDFEVNPFDVDIDGDRATVGVDADGLDSGEKLELPLRKEGGDWRPCLSDIDFGELE
jgi:hypothetical protein